MNPFTWLVEQMSEALLWVFDNVIGKFLDAVIWVIEQLPLPDWWGELGSIFDNIPPGVVFFAEGFMLREGLVIIVGAYLLRFLIRRLPVVG